MEFLTEITYLHWLVLGLVLIGFEVVVPSTFLLWPGVSALVIAAVSFVLPVGPLSALILFAVLGVATSIYWQRWLQKQGETSDKPKLNRRALQYIGRKAVLREGFVDGTGYITLDDTRWRAETQDGHNIEVGARVEVLSVDGVTFTVAEVAADPS
jgi:hypothetical protein